MAAVTRPGDSPATLVPAPSGGVSPGLLLVIGLLSVIAPFATDLYLPAFPTMVDELGTSASGVQLTLTAFLVGVALGQLIFGPLSDRVGRLRPLLVGALLCVVASIVSATAPTVGVLIAARFVQGVAGAAGMVIGRAIISDLAQGRAAARAFSLAMIVGGVAPVVAPVIGSVFVSPIGWRGLLWVVTGISVVMLIAVATCVRESYPPERRAARRPGRRIGTGASAGSARSLLSWAYVGNTVAFGFAFAVMMAYISASPFVYQTMMGLSEVHYGLMFGANALALMGVSMVSARLSATRSVPGLLGTGLGLNLAATLAVLVLVLSHAATLWLTVPILVAVASLGLVLGNATSLALAAVPHAAGTGSAILGALQFGLGALVSPLVGLRGERSALPMAVIMVVAATIAFVAFQLGRGNRERIPAGLLD